MKTPVEHAEQDRTSVGSGEGPAGALVSAAKKPSAPASKRPAMAGRTGDAERERDELKAALASAQARIQALEAAQSQVANRIGWMIEALQTLRDESR